MRRLPIAAAFVAALLSVASAQEVPPHGLVFERWVRDTFFGGYRSASHTRQWDIPASANRHHGGIPVNLKVTRVGTAVDLGDALRQYEIDESFMLVIGFWQQAGAEQRFVNLVAPVVSQELWRKLWGPVTYADLRRLDTLIKDPGPTVEEIRKRALQMKNSPPFTHAIIQVNPKIDDRGQRRLQCSVRYEDVFTHLAPGADAAPQEQPALFGLPYPGTSALKPPETKPD